MKAGEIYQVQMNSREKFFQANIGRKVEMKKNFEKKNLKIFFQKKVKVAERFKSEGKGKIFPG